MLCTSPWTGFEFTTLVVMDTDYIGSCKSNCHTITTTTAPNNVRYWAIIFRLYNIFAWYKVKWRKYKYWSTKQITKYCTTCTPLKTECELRWWELRSSSCYSSGICHVTYKKTTRKYIQSNDKHTKQPPLITVSIDTTSQTLCDTTSLAKKQISLICIPVRIFVFFKKACFSDYCNLFSTFFYL
jgi:hypothetical protein